MLCLFVAAAFYLWDPSGEAFTSPPDARIARYAADRPTVTVWGQVSRQAAGENSISVYLHNAYLRKTPAGVDSKAYPIGNLRVFFKEEIQLKSGMDVAICGEIYPVPPGRNPGAFDGRTYYASQGIYYLPEGQRILGKSPVRNPLLYARERLKEQVRAILTQIAPKEAGLFAAVLLGDSVDVENEIKDAYRAGGILHLLAISGLHLSLLGMGFCGLLERLGAGLRLRAILSVLLVFAYELFTGGSASALRAAIMFSILMGARLLGRCYDMPTALAAAALLLLLKNPAYLWYSGFLLSFLAVLGLAFSSWIFAEREAAGKLSGNLAKRLTVLRRAFGTTLGVWLVTLPAVLYFYGEVSVLGTALNLLVLPTAGVALLSGFLGVLCGSFWPFLGRLCIGPGRLLFKGYLLGAKGIVRLPGAVWVGGRPEFWQIVVYYLLLAALAFLWKREKKFLGVLAGIAGLLAVGWRDHSGLLLTSLDVGQGDAMVWELPGGASYLVDGGSDSQSQVGRYQILPYLKSRGIGVLEGIFVSHTDADHISGIEEILKAQAAHSGSVRVKRLFLPRWDFESEAYQELVLTARAAGVSVIYLQKGDRLRQGEVQVEALYPEVWTDAGDVNGGSLVLQLTYRDFQGIFTGDTGIPQEKEMEKDLNACYFLKVAHHGSKNSSSEEFLSKVCPAVGFISCAENNRYGHPSPEALERLEGAGCVCYSTKDLGALSLFSDGYQVKIWGYLAETAPLRQTKNMVR